MEADDGVSCTSDGVDAAAATLRELASACCDAMTRDASAGRAALVAWAAFALLMAELSLTALVFAEFSEAADWVD